MPAGAWAKHSGITGLGDAIGLAADVELGWGLGLPAADIEPGWALGLLAEDIDGDVEGVIAGWVATEAGDEQAAPGKTSIRWIYPAEAG